MNFLKLGGILVAALILTNLESAQACEYIGVGAAANTDCQKQLQKLWWTEAEPVEFSLIANRIFRAKGLDDDPASRLCNDSEACGHYNSLWTLDGAICGINTFALSTEQILNSGNQCRLIGPPVVQNGALMSVWPDNTPRAEGPAGIAYMVKKWKNFLFMTVMPPDSQTFHPDNNESRYVDVIRLDQDIIYKKR